MILRSTNFSRNCTGIELFNGVPLLNEHHWQQPYVLVAIPRPISAYRRIEGATLRVAP
jgi:hypothetical protein